MRVLELAFEAFGLVCLSYFALLNVVYLASTVVSWLGLSSYLKTMAYSATDEAFSSALTPPITVILPAYNEEAGVVESVRSLLALRYPEFEIVVVNDGSKDATVERLVEAFGLVPVRKAARGTIPTKPLLAAYVSERYQNLVVVDKENGGKADALNVGCNVARYPYVCAIDADAVLEEDALMKVAKPVIDDPRRVVCTGGIVRIANGCTLDHGQVVEVRLPRTRLAAFQVVEYFRGFLVGRVSFSRLQSLLIISGAFGLFRRSLVEEVGGWWTDTVGEDMELVVRIHRHLRDRGQEYAIVFVPDSGCWTECPETLRVLKRQRRRWQRGLAETLWRHRGMIGRRRYGVLGLFGMPFFLVFELLGPLVEFVSYVVLPLGVILDLLSVWYLVAFLVFAILLGLLLSVSALALEEFSFQRHRHPRDLSRLLGCSILENFGYRQLTTIWRVLAFYDLARGTKSWGAMERRGIATGAAAGGAVAGGSVRGGSVRA